MQNHSPILFFDGICNLCSAWTNFLSSQTQPQKIYFAALQGNTANKILGAEKANQMSSLIFYKEGRLYEKSDAFFEIISCLEWYWVFLQIFRIVPHSLRDWVYDQIAARRYSWFGKRESCRVPTAREREYFLD